MFSFQKKFSKTKSPLLRLIVTASITFQQIGPDILGETTGDEFGYSVSTSADGTTIVVGARYNSDVAIDGGHVRVYQFDPSIHGYTQIGLDIDAEVQMEQLGYSVSMSADGTTFVIGAPFSDNNTGRVRVYKFDPFTKLYTKHGSDLIGKTKEEMFGHSVSVSADGSTFAVGAIAGSTNRSGLVRVYKFMTIFNVFDGYFQLGPDIVGESAGDQFGFSVSMSADGTTIVVGVPFKNGTGTSGNNSGQVCVYRFNPANNRFLKIGSDIDGSVANQSFGWSVSMAADGMTFVVGAFLNDKIGGNSSLVRVYKYDSVTKRYLQVGMDLNGTVLDDGFRSSVSMSADGTRFVVGAPRNTSNGISTDLVRVFEFNSSINAYIQIGADILGKAIFDSFGSSVSMSADGSSIVVGARYNNGGGPSAGYVRVFRSILESTKVPTKAPSAKPVIVSSPMIPHPIKAPVPIVIRVPAPVSLPVPIPIVPQIPTKAPVSVPIKDPIFLQVPVKVVISRSPTQFPFTPPAIMSPTMTPTTKSQTSNDSCGWFFGLFCTRNGDCGFFRRLFNINGC